MTSIDPNSSATAVGGPLRRTRVSRRTVVMGAAWSIPVISAAVATPGSAASAPELALEFVDGPYQGIACGTLDPIVVRATAGGVAVPNQPITVSLPAGLTWSDGTTASRTLTSDANGEVVLTDVRVGNRNGTYALAAQTGSVSAGSSVTVEGADRGVVSQFGGKFLPSLPAGVLIEDMQTNTAPNGGVYAVVRGSDGNAYVSSLAAGATTWSAWTKSASPLAGSIADVAISNQGLTNVLASTTQVSLFGGGAPSAALPGGATIVDVQSYTTGGAGSPTAQVVVLASDGRAYTTSFGANGWAAWTPSPATNTPATAIAVSETNAGAVVASANRVSPVAGGPASPVLPGGATITEIATNVNANGQYGVGVAASDGRAYTASYNPTTRTWTGWTASPSLQGSVTQLTMSHTGVNTFVANGNRVALFAGGTPTAPLPNGATIVDVEGTNNNGVPSVSVLGSDGRAYVSSYVNGAWRPWSASRVAQGKLGFISVSEARGWTLVASNPTC